MRQPNDAIHQRTLGQTETRTLLIGGDDLTRRWWSLNGIVAADFNVACPEGLEPPDTSAPARMKTGLRRPPAGRM